jgi:hypothetical protein
VLVEEAVAVVTAQVLPLVAQVVLVLEVKSYFISNKINRGQNGKRNNIY